MAPPAITASCSDGVVDGAAAVQATAVTTSTSTSTLPEKSGDNKQPRDIVILKRSIVNGIVTILEPTTTATATDQSSSSPVKKLSLLFLGCESQPPYGPYEHTATLFMDLLCRSVVVQQQQQEQQMEEISDQKGIEISIHVYHTSMGEIPTPQQIDKCDGVILPGSYNAAYESNVHWIEQLKHNIIQQQLIPKQIPTLGVCFGHQVYAQSYYPLGSATKCPAGSQAGKKPIYLTIEGTQFMNTIITTQQHQTQTEIDDTKIKTLDLFYSHGDMVERLPPNAVSLGGNDKVPIQAAVYYDHDDDDDGDDDVNTQEKKKKKKKVVAVTFQAHPEYAGSTDRGLHNTLLKIIQLMSDRGDITHDDCNVALKDVQTSFSAVEQQSIDVMTISGKLLGWFP